MDKLAEKMCAKNDDFWGSGREKRGQKRAFKASKAVKKACFLRVGGEIGSWRVIFWLESDIISDILPTRRITQTSATLETSETLPPYGGRGR